MQGRDESQHSSHVGAAPESKMAPPSPDVVKKALPSHLSDGDHVPYACTSLRMPLLVGGTVSDGYDAAAEEPGTPYFLQADTSFFSHIS